MSDDWRWYWQNALACWQNLAEQTVFLEPEVYGGGEVVFGKATCRILSTSDLARWPFDPWPDAEAMSDAEYDSAEARSDWRRFVQRTSSAASWCRVSLALAHAC